MKEKTIGILGGMGPEATVELFHMIIKATPAKKDQDHLRIIINNNPKTPDRTEAILKGKVNLLPILVEGARNLEKAGADFIIIPCNTAHYYYEDLKKKVGIPILNMIELTAEKLVKMHPAIKKAGVIGTTGTVKTGIYDQALARRGITVYYPTELQNRVMKAIYEIKAGKTKNAKNIIIEAIKYLAYSGAQVVIIGCTEASLILKNEVKIIPIIDSLKVLAEATVAIALGRCELT